MFGQHIRQTISMQNLSDAGAKLSNRRNLKAKRQVSYTFDWVFVPPVTSSPL